MLKTISSIISLLDKKARANTILLFFLILFYSITPVFRVSHHNFLEVAF